MGQEKTNLVADLDEKFSASETAGQNAEKFYKIIASEKAVFATLQLQNVA